MTKRAPPFRIVAVGGVGGSGTRVLASILSELGFATGPALNAQLDNQWFTLLFKHRGIRQLPALSFVARYRQFRGRMALGAAPEPMDEAERISLLSADRAGQHAPERLAEWLVTLQQPGEPAPGGKWCWKEPNTHVVIDRILDLEPELAYLHVWRDPIYMSRSKNQNQLAMWGPEALGNRFEPTRRGSLAHWVAVHRRMIELRDRFPNRVGLVRFEDLCLSPTATLAGVARFLRLGLDAERIVRLGELIDPTRMIKSERTEFDEYDSRDVAALQSWGLI
jgi:hypothetical protein